VRIAQIISAFVALSSTDRFAELTGSKSEQAFLQKRLKESQAERL
jgi:hypothetical protein